MVGGCRWPVSSRRTAGGTEGGGTGAGLPARLRGSGGFRGSGLCYCVSSCLFVAMDWRRSRSRPSRFSLRHDGLTAIATTEPTRKIETLTRIATAEPGARLGTSGARPWRAWRREAFARRLGRGKAGREFSIHRSILAQRRHGATLRQRGRQKAWIATKRREDPRKQASSCGAFSCLFVAMDWRRSRSVLAAPRWPHGLRYDGADEEDRDAHAFRCGGGDSPARIVRGSTVASVAA